MNIYKIDNTEFVLKDVLELTGNEAEELSKMFSGVFAENADTVNFGNFTAEQMKKFLSIILTPAKGGSAPDDFDFGNYKQITGLQIAADFFLQTIRQRSIMEKYLQGLTKPPKKRSKNSKNK